MQTRIARASALGVALLVLTAIVAATPGGQPPPPPAPTFSKDVAPVIFKNCAGCHRPGEMAPMSLLTYEEARPYARAIRNQVADGAMPPWHAEAPKGTFLNDRRLSDADKDTIIRWANGGAPRGDPKDLPALPEFPEGWEIGTPDVVIKMPAAFEVPASGTIAYKYFEAPTNFTDDKWVQAIEVRPGARSVVHHILVFAREPGAPARPIAYVARVPPPRVPSPTPAPAAGQAAAARPPTAGRGVLLATTAPGTNALKYRPGMATLIKAGAVLTFQVHYTANGEPTKDISSVGLVFAKQAPAQELRTGAFTNAQFVIPPGAADHKVESAIEFTEDSHIWALFPHTHLRGKGWEYRLVHPDGRTDVVLSVPEYDFNWQTYYMFAEPLKAPKGSRLEATARYDNSPENRSNPDAKAEVKWGDQTWQEMQYSGISYTIDSQRLTTISPGQQPQQRN